MRHGFLLKQSRVTCGRRPLVRHFHKSVPRFGGNTEIHFDDDLM